jgi:beta-lactamase class A
VVRLSLFGFKKTANSTPSKSQANSKLISSRPSNGNRRPPQRAPKRPNPPSVPRRPRSRRETASTPPGTPTVSSSPLKLPLGSSRQRRAHRLPAAPSAPPRNVTPIRHNPPLLAGQGEATPGLERKSAPPRRRRSSTPLTETKASSSPRLSRPGARSLPAPMLYILRLLILGVGLGAITGTFLSALNAPIQSTPKADSADVQKAEMVKEALTPSLLSLKQESPTLKQKIEELAAKYPELEVGSIFVDLDTGTYVDIQAATMFAAASTIKLPVLIAFFQGVDSGQIALDEKLTMREDLIAGEAGTMQYQQPGTQFTALETVKKMIEISDNTATNIAIDRLGGADVLNQRFQGWGLRATAIRNLLPDVEGTNMTSPMDLAYLMAAINQGELLSPRSRDRVLDIMQNVKTGSLLSEGLGKEATIAHKTGNIGGLVADAGIIDTPTGKRYIAVVMVKRPHNDPKAIQLIREISRAAYEHFNAPNPAPSASPTTPNVTTTPVPTGESAVAAENQD